MEFIKRICVCAMDVIPLEKLITYESLVKETTYEYHDLEYSYLLEEATRKEKSQYQYLIPKV